MRTDHVPYGPHLHELTAGGLDFGIRRRVGLVINPRVPIYRSVDGMEWSDRWAVNYINDRRLTPEETVEVFAARAARLALTPNAERG